MLLRKFGLYCGVVGPILWLALIAVAGALRPDFNPVTHYISELGERGSTTEALVRYGAFEFTGFLYLCFAGALLAAFRTGWLARSATFLIALDGVGRFGAGMFPCDAGCVQTTAGPNLHTLFATMGFGAGVLATLLWAFLSRRIPPLKSLRSFSVASGAIALTSLLLMSRAADLALPPGLFEHLATVVLSMWMLVFASRLVRTDRAEPGVGGRIKL